VKVDNRKLPQERLDLHNSNIDFAVANTGRCGYTQLETGRVCHLPHRHQGPCQLQGYRQAAERTARSLRG
jgi:hypothetical protein